MSDAPCAGAGPRLARVFLVALVLRAAWALYTRPVPVSDYAEYLDLAQRLVADGAYPPENFRFPGMVWFLAAVLALTGGSVAACIGATVLLATSSVAAVFVFARALHLDVRSATLAAWACALDPTFVAYAPVLGSEHLVTPFVLLGVAAAAREGWSRRRRAGMAAAAIGLATLVRGEGLFYLLPCALALVPARGAPARQRLRRALPAWIGLVAGAGLVILPWVLRNERVVGPGAGLSTSGGYAFYYARRHGAGLFYDPHAGDEGTPLDGLPPIEGNRAGWRLGLALLREDPWGRGVARAAVHTVKLYAPSSYAVHFSTRRPELAATGAYAVEPRVEAAVGPASAVCLLGACGSLALVALSVISPRLRHAAPTRAWLLLGAVVVANWLCYAVVFHGDARYRYVSQAALCVAIGVGLAHARGRPQPGEADYPGSP